ncbi:hypothetical protein [Nocardioides sp.]|uniref:hypothetical protein n=1 Tax=Nocardioides sp. TaxID=35761 RepID=UPI00260F4261|nr:hypothetical protein [Nocardioides sp.]
MSDVMSWLQLAVMAAAISGVTIASVVGALVALARRAWRRIDAELDERIEGVAVRVVERVTGPRFDAIDTRFDVIETRLDRVENRLDGVESRLDRVDPRLDHLEGDMTIVKKRLLGVA